MSYEYTGTKGCGKVLNVAPPLRPGFALINALTCGIIQPLPDPIVSGRIVYDPIFCDVCERLETEYLLGELHTRLGLEWEG